MEDVDICNEDGETELFGFQLCKWAFGEIAFLFNCLSCSSSASTCFQHGNTCIDGNGCQVWGFVAIEDSRVIVTHFEIHIYLFKFYHVLYTILCICSNILIKTYKKIRWENTCAHIRLLLLCPWRKQSGIVINRCKRIYCNRSTYRFLKMGYQYQSDEETSFWKHSIQWRLIKDVCHNNQQSCDRASSTPTSVMPSSRFKFTLVVDPVVRCPL